MLLIELITKHRKELSVPKGVDPQENYNGFSRDLIQAPDYFYQRLQMEETTKFLLDKGFSLKARYYILEKVTRRKSMDNINDWERRSRIWVAFDYQIDWVGGYQRKIEPLQSAIDYGGKEQVLRDLEGMDEIYTQVLWPEFDALKEEHQKIEREKGKDSPEFKFLEEVIENHLQRTGLGRDYIKGLIKMLKGE